MTNPDHLLPFECARWTITRWSGRGTEPDPHPVIYSTPWEDRARARYARIATSLRQGTVRLVTPEGVIERTSSAPRLHTRR